MVPNKLKAPDQDLYNPLSSLGCWNPQYQPNPQPWIYSWSQPSLEQQFPNYQQPTTATAHPTFQPSMSSAGIVNVVQSRDPPASPSVNTASRTLDIAAGKRTRDAAATPDGSPPRKRQYGKTKPEEHAGRTPQRRFDTRTAAPHEKSIPGAGSRDFNDQIKTCNKAVKDAVEDKQAPPIFASSSSGFERLC